MQSKKEKKGTIVYGVSDDLIEIEGGLNEEFNYYADHEFALAVSDGTLLTINYDSVGIWRITVQNARNLFDRVDVAPLNDKDNYTDRAHFFPGIDWIVGGGD